MKKELLFVGLDVHAKNITIAVAEGARKDSVHAAGGGGEARFYGTVSKDLHALEKVPSRSQTSAVWERRPILKLRFPLHRQTSFRERVAAAHRSGRPS